MLWCATGWYMGFLELLAWCSGRAVCWIHDATGRKHGVHLYIEVNGGIDVTAYWRCLGRKGNIIQWVEEDTGMRCCSSRPLSFFSLLSPLSCRHVALRTCVWRGEVA